MTNRYPIPPLTDDQRRAALAKASRIRAERMQLKRDLKQGLVTALPDHGKAKAAAIMRKLDIIPGRRLRGVGVRQRLALLECVEGAER